jgi:hypothetical protein
MAQVQSEHNFGLDDPKEYTCTPSSLLASYPCLQCLSDHELLAVLIGILIYDSEYEDDIAGVMKDSACFTCMSKKQMFQAFATMMGSAIIGDEEGAMEKVVEEMKCLICATDKQLWAALLFLICSQEFERR